MTPDIEDFRNYGEQDGFQLIPPEVAGWLCIIGLILAELIWR